MTVRHNAAASRYELDTEHGLAIAVYREQGDRAIFTHTEVPPADEGKGIGARLVRAALDDCAPARLQDRAGLQLRGGLRAPSSRVQRRALISQTLRVARKAAAAAAAVTTAPQARSTRLTVRGQPRSVARFVRS